MIRYDACRQILGFAPWRPDHPVPFNTSSCTLSTKQDCDYHTITRSPQSITVESSPSSHLGALRLLPFPHGGPWVTHCYQSAKAPATPNTATARALCRSSGPSRYHMLPFQTTCWDTFCLSGIEAEMDGKIIPAPAACRATFCLRKILSHSLACESFHPRGRPTSLYGMQVIALG